VGRQAPAAPDRAAGGVGLLTLASCPYPALNLHPIWTLLEVYCVKLEEHYRALHGERYVDWRRGRSTFLPGIAGEVLVCLLTGLEGNFRLLKHGDGGSDVAGMNIKACTWWPPDLMRPKKETRPWPRWLGLTHIDLREHWGCWVGGVQAWDLWKDGRVVTINEKAGPSYCLDAETVRQRYLAYGGTL
jgi:hypothetical protein